MNVDEEVQPKMEMAMKIPVAAPTWRGGGVHGREAPKAPYGWQLPLGAAAPFPFFYSLDLVLVWTRFSPP
jgi:hypothetical protein